jgi:hypothetical protein
MGDSVDEVFDRQLDRLVNLDYPALAGLDAGAFVSILEPLRARARAAIGDDPAEADGASVPFVIVVSERLVPAGLLVPLLRLDGGTRPGIVDRNHGESGLTPYHPLPELGVPESPAYLLLDVQRGDEFRGVPPQEALPVITQRGRSPLTIHEGIALVTQVPAVLAKNHCFMLSGSRRTGLPGDRRVPALWISERAPKLGWCWDGNPHDWLGVASAGRRQG